ncbi:phosphopantothenate--cysteine ligase (ATP) [Malassezia vespertilionis]|nr:phosphopantothenate--cysteine ligase (ATP) [Malassezia vespertilionis]WFD05747.1 phosphopantothenate--cysteine ligase (ATP) [Malassezia vespertilionis]
MDNFSAGTRGAASAEYFLEAGYAVIFLSRQFSQFPYTRRYSHTTNPFFDILQESKPCSSDIKVLHDHAPMLQPVLHAYHQALRSGLLLPISFVTVVEYLFFLQMISKELAVLGPHAMLYLAAAVSDFFIPRDRMAMHKIQSNNEALHVTLDPVPKVLSVLVQDWAPQAFVVSFKLETDPALLVPKAEKSLQRYGHQLVIANDLHKRKIEVLLIESTVRTASQDGSPPFRHTWVRIPAEESGAEHRDAAHSAEPGHEIEHDIVAALNRMQNTWIECTATQ